MVKANQLQYRAPEEGIDVEGRKARRRARLESTTRKGASPHALEREPYQRIHPYAIVVFVDIRGLSGIEEGSRSQEAAVIAHQVGGSQAQGLAGGASQRAALFRICSGTIARSVAAWSAASRGCTRSDSRAWVLRWRCFQRSVEQCRTGIQTRRGKTRAGWEGLCASGGLRDDAQNAYSTRRPSWEQIRAHRVRQYACKRMRAGVDRLARLRGGLEKSGQTVFHDAGGVLEARVHREGAAAFPSFRSRSCPAVEPRVLALGISLVGVVAGGIGDPEESVASVCVGEGVFCGGFGHRASEVEEEMFGCV
ncbi:hypothetical protein B0H14DRAFT_3701549 [Mycena olivaceomarginata]|nr:hypothetical protein B0H14DRAFT_3701549 [Mycena olivaceomarginata]